MATSGPQTAGPTLPPSHFFTRKRVFLLSIPFVAVFVVVFFFSPVVSATVPDGCVGCYVHYSESPSCAVWGANGYGVTDWQEQYAFDCFPPSVP
jgi:hypothetical protein